MRASYTIFLLLSVYEIVICSGRTLDDPENETDDDNWPVLCPPDTYYNRQLENCMQCSGCPLNTIITSPCYRFQDTKCGPFLEFDLINVQHKVNSGESESDSRETESSFPGPQNKVDSVKGSISAEESLQEEEESRRQWRAVALKMSMIIGGFVALVAVIVIVSIVCIKKRAEREKKLVCEYMPPPGDLAQC